MSDIGAARVIEGSAPERHLDAISKNPALHTLFVNPVAEVPA
jgi:hypothetical protein